MESVLCAAEVLEGAKKVGPDSRFWYRCKYDPVPTEDIKEESLY